MAQLPISCRELTDAEQKGAQLVLNFLDNKFNLGQDDPMYYHIKIFRADFHKFIKKHRLDFRGGW